jgi:hypothetical protein
MKITIEVQKSDFLTILFSKEAANIKFSNLRPSEKHWKVLVDAECEGPNQLFRIGLSLGVSIQLVDRTISKSDLMINLLKK